MLELELEVSWGASDWTSTCGAGASGAELSTSGVIATSSVSGAVGASVIEAWTISAGLSLLI